MTSNIRLYTVNHEHWLGVEIDGQLYLICYKGKAGDRICP